MNNCNIVGRVIKAKVDTTQSGKQVGKLRVEVRKKYGDKTYSTRFDVQVYGQEAQAAGSIQVGATVWASGEVSAYINEHQGKQYANLQLTGRVGVVDTANLEAEQKRFQETQPQARQTTNNTAQSAITAQQIPSEQDDSDVPF